MRARPDRVVAVIRHREAVLGCRSDGSSSAITLPWSTMDDTDPESALARLGERLDIEFVTVERRGDPLVGEGSRLVPFLVSAAERSVTGNEACHEPTWTSPTAFLRSGDDPWWRAYTAVGPTVETVAADTERGSTAIATDALWVLRDEAARAAVRDHGLAPVKATARSLLDARPSMAALGNRVNRAMAGAGTPFEVEQAATEGIARAFAADETAARLAAETIDGARVLTLSRSGTVRDAVLDARSDVVVLASRPGGEGLGFADSLADSGLLASTIPDGEVYSYLRRGDVDAVLVGADAVTPDGGVVNKVGTRAAALAAEWAGVPCYVVCASDKIRPVPEPDETAREEAVLLPLEPLFDWTPPRLVSALLTERGRLATADASSIAEEHRRLTRW